MLVDLRPKGVDGSRGERVLELVHIAANKNTVPGGPRMGTPALTTRGFTEKDFVQVAEFVDEAVQITQMIREKTGPKLKDFRNAVDTQQWPEIDALKAKVEAFAKNFPTIGFEKADMRYTS